MKRTTALGLMLAGTVVLGAAYLDCKTRYSNENIWRRQRILIDRSYRRQPELRRQKFDQLRKDLEKLEGASMEERCRYDRFSAAVLMKGSEKAGKEHLETRNYDPYAMCKPSGQIQAEAEWYNIGGAVAFLAGVYGMIASFFRKREREDFPRQNDLPPERRYD